MNPDELKKLLEKHQLGRCTEEEIKWLDAWLDSLAGEEKDISDDELTPLSIKHQLRQRIRQAITEQEASQPMEGVMSRSFWKVAASIVLFIGLGLTTFLFVKNIPFFQPNVSDVAFFNPAGQQKTLILPDGTKVYLNAQTTFRYPKEFAGDTRLVYLEGEAFFEVARNADKPFIIHTGKLKTQVIGTSFNVKAYQQDEEMEVAVLTGKVSVSDSLVSVMLKPNQKASYNLINKRLTQTDIANADEYRAWIEGKLVFEDELLPEIINVLNRKYNVKIELRAENLKKCTLNAQFKNEPLANVLDKICLYLEASYKINGKQIIIGGGGC